MKKSITALATSFLCISAFAQGRLEFNNDSLHLVYWGPSAGAFAGQPVNSDNVVPGLPGLSVDLYLGTSSSQLFLYSSTTFGTIAAGPGRWTPVSVTVNPNAATGAPGIPGGTTVFVEVAVHSTERASPNIFDPAAFQTFQAYGASVEFPFTLGSSITFPSITSTWPPGGIEVNIPEPATFALAALGGVAMLLFRRRK